MHGAFLPCITEHGVAAPLVRAPRHVDEKQCNRYARCEHHGVQRLFLQCRHTVPRESTSEHIPVTDAVLQRHTPVVPRGCKKNHQVHTKQGGLRL